MQSVSPYGVLYLSGDPAVPKEILTTPPEGVTMTLASERDRWARMACRELGGLLNAYVTGDPDDDSLAEYIAAGWLILDDYYTDDDDPPRDVPGQLARSLRTFAQALDRMAREVEIHAIPLDGLRRLDLPRWERS